MDLNQDFWYRNDMTAGLNPFEERYRTLLQNVTNWNNPENYYSKVHVIGQVKDLINEYRDMLLELDLNRNSEVIRENRDMYNFDALEQMDISRRIDAEVYALNSIAEDDDIGDDDDQVPLNYGDL